MGWLSLGLKMFFGFKRGLRCFVSSVMPDQGADLDLGFRLGLVRCPNTGIEVLQCRPSNTRNPKPCTGAFL